MQAPEWADADLSEELPVLRAQGESQELEYIRSMPSNGHELAKEIAAFASTNAGMILLGVADDGQLHGLAEAETRPGRDEILRRVQGLASGPVQPALTPRAAFAVDGEKVVLVLNIRRGDQPVYYVNGKPYVRDLTSARPARPHEVIERIRDWLEATGVGGGDGSEAPPSPKEEFLTRLGMTLTRMLLWGREAPARRVQPGIGLLKAELQGAADDLRDLASEEMALDEGLADEMNGLADLTDGAARYRHTLGMESWNQYLALVEEAVNGAELLRAKTVDQATIPQSTQKWAEKRLRKLTRRLDALAEQATEWARTGRLQELEAEVSNIGLYVLELAYLALSRSDGRWLNELRQVGHRLHLVDQARARHGSHAIERVTQIVKADAKHLARIMEQYIEQDREDIESWTQR